MSRHNVVSAQEAEGALMAYKHADRFTAYRKALATETLDFWADKHLDAVGNSVRAVASYTNASADFLFDALEDGAQA